ncbi:hypothetical protein Forpe1208_v014467 [Fusarium oxysporum f. sp. rapae]|uniref:NACHT domain-containing protein n=1 Tax=Fusarium oxysporum f. sp. rapae TaxID=485398 RepID=A0A8J5NIF7_FUSOX|nr:hypothetical protein Forpe1208_v014467 [Fusarium oxysporum f. sp. rapae]
MSCIVTDHLIDVDRPTKARTAYFYFDYKSQETQRPFSVVSCLLRQVLSQYSTRPKQVDALWELFDRKQGLPSWQMLVDKFCQICSKTPVYVVLDALDECDATENRGPILGFIEEMRRRNVRLFATSRPFPQDILDAFEGAVPVDIEASNTDLRRYLLDAIRKSKKNKSITTQKLTQRIVAKIIDNSQGMFLLATFQINYVLSQNSRGEINESLKELPKGLWANFDMTMKRIDSLPYEHQVRFAKQTLLWTTTAARPLKVNEIRYAMRISEAPHDFKLSTNPAGQLFVEYYCGFVVIDSRSDTVRLAHFSIDEYLRQRQFEFITCGNKMVSLACVNYMLLPWLPGTFRHLVEDEDVDGIAEQDTRVLDNDRASKLSFSSSLGQSGDKVPTAAKFDALP